MTKEQIVLPILLPSQHPPNSVSVLSAVNLIPNSLCVAVSLAGVKNPSLLPSSPSVVAL